MKINVGATLEIEIAQKLPPPNQCVMKAISVVQEQAISL